MAPADPDSSSSFDVNEVGSVRVPESSRKLDELVEDFGSYATSEAVGGTYGFALNNHLMCSLRLFRGIRTCHRYE
jgi:hypothetical protein